MSELLRRIWSGSIRRQLILAFALAHAVLIGLFIYDLVERQGDFLHQQSLKQAIALSHSLAVTSTPWVLANDLVGMEEVVLAVNDYPELRYAMLLSPRGRVLAHTDSSRAGKYLADKVSLNMLSDTLEPHTLVNTEELLDTASPIINDGRLIGWARVSLGQEANRQGVATVARNGFAYMGLAILLGGLVAMLVARGMTRGLHRLMRAADRVSSGQHEVRLEIDRRDEIGQLAVSLERMRDTLVANERKLAESEERYRIISDNVHDVIFMLDLRTERFTYVSPSVKRRRGYTAEEVMGQSLAEAVVADSYSVIQQKLRERVEAFLHDDNSLDTEGITIRQPCRDGSIITSEVIGTILADEEGNPREVVGVTRDITERIEAEERLRATHQLLDSIIENIPNMIFLKDAEQLRFVRLNRAAKEILGINPSEMIGKSDLDFFPAEQAEFFIGKDREVLASHRVVDIPLEEVLNGSGETVLLHTKKLALRNEAGESEYLLGISEDITERVRAEQELERYHNHLESLVEARTSELAQAKEEAEAANRAKSVFLANMSHELRTPLNAILGFSQILMRDQEIAPRHGGELTTINRAGHHLLGLINDVLELSRIEAGRIALQNHPIDLNEVINAAADMTRLRAEQKGLEFTLDYSKNLPRYVVGDDHLLRQVIINLLNNAAKYTEKGFVQLQLESLEGEVVRFCIKDSGQGISAQEQQSIFQAFYQTASGSAQGEGTGLGLTISQEYVRLMGGELVLKSEPGVGSQFCFAIKLPASEAPETIPSLGQVLALAGDERRHRVMVVEDDADNRQLICSLLEGVGFVVRALTNGEEAVAEFARWRPRLIWMDMRMPVMDGYEATRRIRALPGGDEVKIVALTASAFAEDRPGIIAAGCDDMMTKPFDEEKMFKLMGKLLELRYRYSPKVIPEAVGVGPVPSTVELSSIPDELLSKLQSASLELDVVAAEAVLAQLRERAPQMAATLGELVHNYRFDKIIQIIGDALPEQADPDVMNIEVDDE